MLWESRAILGYLANKYGKDDSLYPKDPVKRALVDQRLYFDMGVLYQRFSEYYYPQIMKDAPADPEKYQKMVDGVEFLNNFLEGQKFVAGDSLTIADYAIVVSVSSYVDGAEFSLEKYPNIQRWFDTCKTAIPSFARNAEGSNIFKGFFAKLTAAKN